MSLDNYLQWWRYVPGANWRHPTGPAGDIKGKGNYPVVQVAYADAGLAPVAQFPPNGYGLYDMAGNVWQWCSDWYRADYYFELKQTGVVVRNPQGPPSSYDPGDAQPPHMHRGGSFLCTDEYCTRYMLGTRGKGDVDTGSNHLGFRCVKPAGPNIK